MLIFQITFVSCRSHCLFPECYLVHSKVSGLHVNWAVSIGCLSSNLFLQTQWIWPFEVKKKKKPKPTGPLYSLVFCSNINKCLRAYLYDISNYLEMEKNCEQVTCTPCKDQPCIHRASSLGGSWEVSSKAETEGMVLASLRWNTGIRLAGRNPGRQ